MLVLQYFGLDNYIIIISALVGLCCLLVSRYVGREFEKCNTTSSKFSLIFCLLYCWIFNSFMIWLAIKLLLLEILNQ